MSVGEYYAPVTGIAWQPPQGWDIASSDPPVAPLMPEFPAPWWGILPPLPLDQRVRITTSIATSDVCGVKANAEHIAALDAEVARLRHECKRLQRKLAQRRRR